MIRPLALALLLASCVPARDHTDSRAPGAEITYGARTDNLVGANVIAASIDATPSTGGSGITRIQRSGSNYTIKHYNIPLIDAVTLDDGPITVAQVPQS